MTGRQTSDAQMTPMMRQYLDIKEQYTDYLLFYRMGDFYEMFFDDAHTAARELEITLTSRNKNEKKPVPMCGVPVKAAEIYLGRLIEKGYKVAICEQTEDPAAAKGLVKREVVRVVTPGMVLNSDLLDARTNNFIVSILGRASRWGLSCLDLSTGAFRVTESGDVHALLEEIRRIAPSEILMPAAARTGDGYEIFCTSFEQSAITWMDDGACDYKPARQRLIRQFQTRSLEGFGCEGLKAGIGAAGALLFYVQETQKQQIAHLSGLETYFLDQYLQIDDISCRNLELLANLRDGTRKATLLSVLDFTITAMGGRLIKHWIRYPLLGGGDMAARHEAVDQLAACGMERKAIRASLKSVADLERLGSKIVMGQANARDLVALRRSIEALPEIHGHLAGFSTDLLCPDTSILPELTGLGQTIAAAVVDDPPPVVNEGGMIRTGYDDNLDELIAIARDGKSFLAELEAREKQATGIQTLKVRYNKVFGYYIEVSKSQADAVPAHYVRKQTLVNAERYITDELKSFEAKVLGAQEQRAFLEYEIFCKLRDAVAQTHKAVAAAAAFVAQIDVLNGLSEAAVQNQYVRPAINEQGVIDIAEGRHPVVEKLIEAERFVPNSLRMDNRENQVLIITGPNMAGKSTVLRQAALIVLMAQMGSFVPADRADIAVTDRIFTRVGALDNLSQGQSTFMVEMEETANIMNNATSRSLVIMDEIGRGTSTFDGLSIAWAVAEYLHDLDDTGVKSMFATHYHELTELHRVRRRVKNYNIAVREINDEIIFLHQLAEGGTNRSYGIEVARLAGMPEKVVERAKKVLENVEKQGHVLGREAAAPARRTRVQQRFVQLPLFQGPEQDVIESLRQAEVEHLTPMDAMNLLYQLRQKLLGQSASRSGNSDAGNP
ncbi:MAG: DNA mismatch repair protein MutS [Desulfosalsimonas sp.]|uniref:DNA mismatch repair protein MutS n=1 Tax=Desulfosalsimonas sp. TaxID=3073848 RepID=UPI003970B37F